MGFGHVGMKDFMYDSIATQEYILHSSLNRYSPRLVDESMGGQDADDSTASPEPHLLTFIDNPCQYKTIIFFKFPVKLSFGSLT